MPSIFEQLTADIQPFMLWEWSQIEPYYDELKERVLNEESIDQWLRDWTHLGDLLDERRARLYVAMTQDTSDQSATDALNRYMDEIYPQAQAAEIALNERLLSSGFEPSGMEIPLRNMRADTELFCEENLSLVGQETRLSTEYRRTIGAQTVSWEGEEITLTQLKPKLQTPDRAVREAGWTQIAARQLDDREALNAIWTKLLTLRSTMAANAGFDDYIAFRWKQLKRFDYSPADAALYHSAIEDVVVPAANRIYERYKTEMGIDRIRPWDVQADVFIYALPALRPFDSIADLEAKTGAVLYQVDPVLGDRFEILRNESLLDLGNRKGKSPGGYCTSFSKSQRPFIFMNAVGTGDDIRTLLHEAGHAFHGFERLVLPYRQQRRYPMEFAEVASMAMELLAAPYLDGDSGAFFDEADAARWRTSHLEKIILFWPYMAVVDAFQHWAYSNIERAMDPSACDEKWGELWQRFIPAVDFNGYEAVMQTGWHRKQHIFSSSFYYIEYGLAQVGAVQIWRNALDDQSAAVREYRHALSLGGTQGIPALFQAAGAKFSFDHATMADVVSLIETQLENLSAAIR